MGTPIESQPEKPKSPFDALLCDVNEHARAEGAKRTGQSEQDFEHALLSNDNPGDAMSVIDKLVQAFDGLSDQVYAILCQFGFERDEIDASQQKIEDREQYDTREQAPKDWASPEVEVSARKREKRKLGWTDWQRAEHAKNSLNENPQWRIYIEKSAQKRKIPAQLLVTIIGMESGFNSKARCSSGAAGLSQVMPGTLRGYINDPTGASEFMRETGKSKIDPYDPETGIDIAAWVIRSKIMSTQNFPPAYRITSRPIGTNDVVRLEDITSVEDLYLTYNSGSAGYLKWRQYEENPTPENFAKLCKFQQENVQERAFRKAYEKNPTQENFDKLKQFQRELAEIRRLRDNPEQLEKYKKSLEQKYGKNISELLRYDAQNRLAYARRVGQVGAAIAQTYS